MAKRNVTLRVEEELIDRARILIEHVKNDHALKLQAVATVKKSTVLKLAVAMGIEGLEKKYRVRLSQSKERKR